MKIICTTQVLMAHSVYLFLRPMCRKQYGVIYIYIYIYILCIIYLYIILSPDKQVIYSRAHPIFFFCRHISTIHTVRSISFRVFVMYTRYITNSVSPILDEKLCSTKDPYDYSFPWKLVFLFSVKFRDFQSIFRKKSNHLF